MNFNQCLFILFFYLHYQINECDTESITYLSTERPVVNWFDKTVFKNFTLRSRRLSRGDPKHYVEIDLEAVVPMNNTIQLHFYFYQFLTNRYRPSFVELHFKLCDFINYDTWFGQELSKALGGRQCPYPPGAYHLRNMSIPFVPKNFPFNKGRIYCNMTHNSGSVTRTVLSGSIDMEIKVARIIKN